MLTMKERSSLTAIVKKCAINKFHFIIQRRQSYRLAQSFCIQKKTINAHSLNVYHFTTLYEANFLSAWNLVISVTLSISVIHVLNKEVSYGKEIT